MERRGEERREEERRGEERKGAVLCGHICNTRARLAGSRYSHTPQLDVVWLGWGGGANCPGACEGGEFVEL